MITPPGYRPPDATPRCPDCGEHLGVHLDDGACPCRTVWCVRRRAHPGRCLPYPGQQPIPIDGEPAPMLGGAA